VTPIHPTYLPFEAETLRKHFADVSGSRMDDARHLRYYQKSAAHHGKLRASESSLPAPTAAERRRLETYGHQMQKDERFWVVTALKTVFDSDDRVAAFAELFRLGTGGEPEGATWLQLLGDPADLRLYFEVNLPAPERYLDSFRETAGSRVFLPWLRDLARSRAGARLEGTTKVDAMLVSCSTGFAAAFEAKVLSDVSTHTTYDPTRNQLARLVDVLLDHNPKLHGQGLADRRPEKTFLFLLTPKVFQDKRHTRLYGELLRGYKADPGLLREHLPHRDDKEIQRAAGRLGWLTWEDCNEVVPGACSWLDAHQP
jgi:hypothetical protein